MALILPWAELICGLMLVLGLRAPGSGSFGRIDAGGLLCGDCRHPGTGIPIGCGCFTSVEDPLSWKTLLRDLPWLAMTVQVVWFPSALQLEDRLLLSLKEVDG